MGRHPVQHANISGGQQSLLHPRLNVFRVLQVVLNHVVLEYLPAANITASTDVLSLGGVLSVAPDAAGAVTVTAPGMPTPAQVCDLVPTSGLIHCIITCLGLVNVRPPSCCCIWARGPFLECASLVSGHPNICVWPVLYRLQGVCCCMVSGHVMGATVWPSLNHA